MKNPNFPKIHSPQVAVVIAERATGIVVLPDKIRVKNDKRLFQIFDSLEKAESFVRDSGLLGEFEFSIYSAEGALIKFTE